MNQGKQYYKGKTFRLSREVQMELKRLHLETGLSHDLLFKRIIESYTGKEIKRNGT